jgi:nucleoside-diphosphate-sugar epimerase
MKVAVTGAAGFLGRAVTACLRRSGFDVVAISRTSSDGCLGYDLSDAEQVCAMLRHVSPEVVINCAAVADFAPGTITKQYAVNILLPGILANWAFRTGGRIVQISGTIVHGIHCSYPGPQSPINPDSDYGRSKWLAEELLNASGCDCTILRFGGIFGKGGPEHLRLNVAIREAMKGMPPTISGGGKALRNYIHATDAAIMVRHCLDASEKGTFWAGGETLSIAQMLQLCCDVFLPGQTCLRTEGEAASDQVVMVSPELPAVRSFLEALKADL